MVVRVVSGLTEKLPDTKKEEQSIVELAKWQNCDRSKEKVPQVLEEYRHRDTKSGIMGIVLSEN